MTATCDGDVIDEESERNRTYATHAGGLLETGYSGRGGLTPGGEDSSLSALRSNKRPPYQLKPHGFVI